MPALLRHAYPPGTLKRCSRCGVEQPRTQQYFSVHYTNRLGVDAVSLLRHREVGQGFEVGRRGGRSRVCFCARQCQHARTDQLSARHLR